jgi:hypothetical protein
LGELEANDGGAGGGLWAGGNAGEREAGVTGAWTYEQPPRVEVQSTYQVRGGTAVQTYRVRFSFAEALPDSPMG